MMISDLNHLETVSTTQDVLGGLDVSTLISFSVYNSAYVKQDAYSTSIAGKATSGIGDSNANASSYATNYSSISQANLVYGVGIDP